MFLAKTLHKTWYRELIYEKCTLFDKRCQKFLIPRILKSENILFSRNQNVYFSDLGSSEWGWGINCSYPPPASVTVMVCSKSPYGSLRCHLLWPGNGPHSRKES